jgi:hypothetical protein
LCEAGSVLFWNVRFGTEYDFAPKLKKYYVGMIVPVVAGLLIVAVLSVFFYRTAKMDIAGSIITAAICAGLLALLVTAAIYAGQIFG